MTIQPPKILTEVPDDDYSFLRDLARKNDTSVSLLASEILSEAVQRARRKTVSKRPQQSLDEVLDEVAKFNGTNP